MTIGFTEISASLMCADFARLSAQLDELRAAGVTRLHLDFADGHFVPNLLLGTEVFQLIRGHDFFVESHLIIENPELYIDRFVDGSNLIVFHWEATRDPCACLKLIHAAGRKAAIAINPSTPVANLTPFLGQIDQVVIMTVEPGFAGAKFLPETVAKVSELKGLLETLGATVDIEVDGGINPRTIPALAAAGANVFVGGSTGLFAGSDLTAQARAMFASAGANK